MPNRFAQGKRAFGFCSVCGQRSLLSKLQPQVIKQKVTNSLRCRECLDADHPQLMLGTFPIDDPQALRNPRPDPALQESRAIRTFISTDTWFDITTESGDPLVVE